MGMYNVEVPVTVRVKISVRADSAEEAKEKVFDEAFQLEVTDEKDNYDMLDWEWEMHEKIVQGNFFHGLLNEVEIEKEDYEEDYAEEDE